MKQLIHSFAIKAVKATHTKRVSKSFVKVGRKCQAVVINDNSVLKARLVSSPVEGEEYKELTNLRVVPFTDKSFELKGKTFVFRKRKDKLNHYICEINSSNFSKSHPGLDEHYTALREGLLLSGHIMKRDNRFYFNYEELVAFTENGQHINKGLLDEI